jgi:dephospho-CoA kinase
MIVIGLTGSIAMGKSEVAKIFAAAGWPVFDADAEVHALYESAEGAALLRDLAPTAVEASRVDRNTLSQLVIANPKLLPPIEQQVHAEIARRRSRFIDNAKAQGHAAVVVDVPLLFETGGDKHVDVTVVVSSPKADQYRRALARPRMTPEKLDMILKRQMPDIEKRKRADFIIENTGSLDALAANTHAVLHAIMKNAHA